MKQRSEKQSQIIKILIHVGIFIGLLVLIWSVYLFISFFIRRYTALRFTVCDINSNFIYQVTKVEIEEEKLKLSGWIFQSDINSSDMEVILYDEKTEHGIFAQVTKKESKKINEYFRCQNDYSEIGFEAEVFNKKLDLQNTNYEILFRLKNTKNAYRSGYYLIDGKLKYLPVIKDKPIEAKGDFLKRIVTEGILLAYDQKYGMYIYQYGKTLYWIADVSLYPFSEKGQTYIFFHLNTTQKNYLPEHRKIHGFDNPDFIFEQCEITDIDEIDYRVATENLPQEYAITSMFTGEYDRDTEKYVWRTTLACLQYEPDIID